MKAAEKARLYVPDALAPGAAVTLGAEQHHYLRNVLRLAEGDAVTLFNGRDGEYSARIEKLGKKEAIAAVATQLRPFAPAADIWLCFAPIRQGRIEFIVEKATELGVGRLLPVQTQRSQIGRVNTDRLSAHAREAAEQCERLDVPQIAAATSLDDLLATWPAERRLFFCVERGAADALLGAAQAWPKAAPCGLLVGPEGGFAPAEQDRVRALPQAVPVSLGGTILRAETAAIAALAILQSVRQN
ncbi:MAG TPA: 16S rRNA (uracil(1498)-N(3))-methyltransferase [Ferrovibrio sp.]|uniref:16S rRNA (uracil(1498)-N(3))-methyltransferase n=1 Tax=Ferrovibrio sp. TaxID=1917215 RepID=UPI002ED2A88A